MDWAMILGYVLTGGVGTAILNQAVSGWRQRSRAQGRLDSKLDALTRSRLWLLERLFQHRRVIIDAGAPLPPFDETGDPYLVWEAKTITADDKTP